MLIELFILLFICHFLCDFTPLSTAWMLKAKQAGKPLLPILAHAGMHAGTMFIVLLFFTNLLIAFKLGCFQLLTHFIIDVWKGRMNSWFPILRDSTKKSYWIIFGFDQFLHQLVIVLMVSYLF